MRIRFVCFIIFGIILCNLKVVAQNESQAESRAYVTNSFWDNWYVQVGMDMWLQNPHGANFKNVFPNGKSFGLDLALGKWITPEYGFRGSLNWENGIFKSDNASWIRENSKSYMVIAGDFLVNMTNLLSEYRPDRKWNISVFPRAGALLDLIEGDD